MAVPRPDLSQLPAEVSAYILHLESEIARLRAFSDAPALNPDESDEETVPSEPPTTINVISMTARGVAKRTPRNYYTRQRRGGMGVFDIQTPDDDPPCLLAIADQSQTLLVLTNMARAFRLPVNAIPETPIRGRGESVVGRLGLNPEETIAVILPVRAQGYVAMLSQTGNVRLLRHHVFGEYMKPGVLMFDTRTFGKLTAACWTPGESELVIATSQGRAIRFSEKIIPPQGGAGIRLAEHDQAIGICAVYPDSGVFLINREGKGTIRLMEGFLPNKAAGAGGKIIMETDQLAGVFTVESHDELFILSTLSKVIRFSAGEVPAKDSAVQGVFCMTLRADQVSAVAVNSLKSY